MAIDKTSAYQLLIAPEKLINSTGAGDSMLAAFVSRWLINNPLEQCLQWATATGCATSYTIGLANNDQITQLIDQVKIIKII